MKNKYVILILIILGIHNNVIPQSEYKNTINKFNKQGQKNGLWKEDLEYQKTETYYQDGLKTGIYKAYSPKGELVYFGEFDHDIIAGTWYYFNDYGHLIMIQTDFSPNLHPIPIEHSAQGFYTSKCYTIIFHPNGRKESEGIMLFYEDPESDCFEYGEWKYYDPDGNLANVKMFK